MAASLSGPEDRIVLTGGGEALRYGGKALGHAKGEADIDGERITGAGVEEGAGDGVEDGGVDEAFAGAEIVVGDGEVDCCERFCQGANGSGMRDWASAPRRTQVDARFPERV